MNHRNRQSVGKQRYLIVSKDGTGDFRSIQEAINTVPEHCEPITIFVKSGIYREVVRVPKTKQYISLVGENAQTTIITYDNFAGKQKDCGGRYGTSESASFYVFADDFRAENLTIENSFDYTLDVCGKQAVAAYTSGRRLVFKHVRFLGHQDTLYANAGTQFFFKCYIRGNVDFIFGAAQAVFEECEIESLDRRLKVNGYVTAASTPIEQEYGYLFLRCNLLSDAQNHTVYLGRPWHPGGDPDAVASVVFKKCYLGSHIHPVGWTDMSGFTATSARFYEYQNSGPGVSAYRKQLTDDEAKQFTKTNVLGGWDPEN